MSGYEYRTDTADNDRWMTCPKCGESRIAHHVMRCADCDLKEAETALKLRRSYSSNPAPRVPDYSPIGTGIAWCGFMLALAIIIAAAILR